jgi:hypothetical protein
LHLPALDSLQRFAWWTLAAAPLVAHAAAWWVRLALAPRGLSARPNMPTLPVQDPDQGTPAARFDRGVERTLGVVLTSLLQQPQDIQGETLAATLGEDPELVRAALDRIRARVPCRMRVTAAGSLLYDFRTSDLQRFRQSRVLGWPARVLWLLLGLVVNVGAAWPLLASLVLGAATLERMLQAHDDQARVIAGLLGLAAILATFALDWLAGHAVAWLIHPGWRTPKLLDAPTLDRAERKQIRKEARADRQQKREAEGKSTWGLGDLSAIDIDGEGCAALPVILLVILLLAAIAGALLGLALWVRGLWRTLARPEPSRLDVAPGVWVRDGRSLEQIAALVPTSDVATALLKALRHGMRRQRPGDKDLARRVLGRARHQQGAISALEVALHEGVDLDEALRIGARLAGLHGGEVHVTPAGELDFRFAPPTPGQDTAEVEPPPYEAMPGPGVKLDEPGVRVNVPGLTASHLRAGDRLAGGTLVTAALLVMTAHELATRGLFKTGEVLDIALPLLAATVFAVVGATRALVDWTAALGMRRDARRAAYDVLRRALADGHRQVEAQAVTADLFRSMRTSWARLQPAVLQAEVEQAWTDLDLGLDAAVLAKAPKLRAFDVRPLAARLQAIAADRTRDTPRKSSETVVFDTGWSDEPP